MSRKGGESLVKKMSLFIGLLLLVLVTACQAADANEVLEYHNDYVDNVLEKVFEIDSIDDQIWNEDLEEEDAINLIDNDLEPLLEDLKSYMDKLDPEGDDARDYHELRMDWFNAYYDVVKTDLETYRGIINDTMSDEEINDKFEETEIKFDKSLELAEKADKKIDELSDKYKFEDAEE